MKNKCNIVRDLLPLYVEGIASKDTVAFVDEHIQSCASCRSALENMREQNAPAYTAATPQELPLKAFRKKWKQKLTHIICATISATLIALLCVGFAAEVFVYEEKIAVNGHIYLQTSDEVTQLPDGCTELGYLQGISTWTTADPSGDFMATNLDTDYGGHSLYQNSTEDSILYLQDTPNSFIIFERSN